MLLLILFSIKKKVTKTRKTWLNLAFVDSLIPVNTRVYKSMLEPLNQIRIIFD